MLKHNLRTEQRLPKATAKMRLARREAPLPWTYVVLAAVCCAALAGMALWNSGTSEAWQKPATKLKEADIPFGGERAYQVLKEICAIGPRVAGTEGMRRQQAVLRGRYREGGGRVRSREIASRA